MSTVPITDSVGLRRGHFCCLVAIPITAGFGSNGPPFIYDSIRRFLQWLHVGRMAVQGLPPLMDIFVDDAVGFGPARVIVPDFDSHDSAINSLLGPGSAHKREFGPRLDVIGARFDFEAATIGISYKDSCSSESYPGRSLPRHGCLYESFKRWRD